MAIKVDGINSEDELRKAEAAAQAQGTSIVNYNEWAEILEELSQGGIESTGSYAGDKARLQEVREAVAEYVEELRQQEQVQQYNPQNNDTDKVQNAAQNDREQYIKANVANATSSEIMANYMKYYHMLV